MFGNLGLPEVIVIALLGLVIFGPDRLPKAAADAAQLIKRLRAMSHGAMSDLRSELGPEYAELDFRSMHPRRIVEDAWNGWDGDAEQAEPSSTTRPTPEADVTKAKKA